MDTQYLFETYTNLPKKGQVVFLDILDGLIEYIRVIPKFKGTITDSTVEGTDIIVFTYKNGTACGPEVRKNFNISDSLELSTLAMMRISIMEILEKGKLVQKLRLDKKSEELLEQYLLISEEDFEYFYHKDPLTKKYHFNPDAIRREGENIVCMGKMVKYDELDEEAKKSLDLYDKLVLSFGYDELSNISNLDESYFHWDLFLTSSYNLSVLGNILRNDEGKNIIEKVGFGNGDMLINGKIYHLEIRKGSEKAKDFLTLLSLYFSHHDTEQVSLTELVGFTEERKLSFKKLTTKDIANSKQVNSYLGTFHENIWKKFGGKPRIFQKKSTIISLEKTRKTINSPSLEAR